MFKATAVTTLLLLFTTSQVFANRPGLEDRSPSAAAPTQMSQPVESPQETVYQATMGDVVEITEGETIDVKLLDFPSRGMSMKKVLSVLGKPIKTPPAVGDPPIRLWVYDDRTIYFEEMTVIHVVSTR